MILISSLNNKFRSVITLLSFLSLLGACNNESNDLPVASDSTVQDANGEPSSGDVNNDAQTTAPSLEEVFEQSQLLDNSAIIEKAFKQGDLVEADENSPSGEDFRFPEIVSTEAGEQIIVIEDVPLPSISTRRELQAGSGDLSQIGDQVIFNYDMFSWSTGKLVESTTALDDNNLIITLGSLATGNQVPKVLHNALLNRRKGSRIQVVFEHHMNDLPDYLNPHDSYVLVVDVEDVIAATN